MALSDALAGPPRKQTVAGFFDTHPGVLDEVKEARRAGYTWPQIRDALQREHGYQACMTSLARHLERL